MSKVRVIQVGLGPIGRSTARLAWEKGFELVGGVDIDPQLAGRDLGEVLGLDRSLGLKVTSSLEEALARKPDIALHTTASYLSKVGGQLKSLIQAGVNVISTTEELSYPWLADPQLAEELNQLARENGAVVLGAGVNPGFIMDALVLALTGACLQVDQVRAERVVDASTRRLPLQRKVGAGMKPEEFRALVAQKRLGHVGLRESVALIAAGLGVKPDRIDEQIEPVIAEREIKTPYLTVKPGEVAGLDQRARGYTDGRLLIDLHLQMYVGAPNPHDAIEISGQPPLRLVIEGGTPGDQATAALVVNSIPRVLRAAPGLYTVKDLPMATAILGEFYTRMESYRRE
jgi:4-hydroxy-tetrahydrodipicolinate reductase